MTVHDLLTMQTGHDHETSGSLWRPIPTSWVAEFFKIPVTYTPGTYFVYTSAASFMLSAIVTKTTGQTMEDYLRPRFLEPLGINTLHWDLSPGGINPGGNGHSWPTDASLKLGALHAQMGRWNGQQILSEKWVKAATTRQSGDDEDNYGYQWWMGPGKAYYALGLFTQLSIVFPEHDATLAVFGAIDGSSKLKPFIWKHFPAAFGPAPAAPSPVAGTLAAKTAQLRLLPPLKPLNSPVAARISGKRYRIAPNDQAVEWISFGFDGPDCTYIMQDDRGEHSIVSGLSQYLEQGTDMTGHRLHHEYQMDDKRVVAGARWIDANHLEMTWQYVEAAFCDTVVCSFDGDTVSIDRSVNVNSAATRLPTLKGVLV
ncbi:MAG: beta-lactamase family protein [Alphaproteobacteria bacterium]|nr:beta-lactamase family protein [Alphaproteobacteria bacterium]